MFLACWLVCIFVFFWFCFTFLCHFSGEALGYLYQVMIPGEAFRWKISGLNGFIKVCFIYSWVKKIKLKVYKPKILYLSYFTVNCLGLHIFQMVVLLKFLHHQHQFPMHSLKHEFLTLMNTVMNTHLRS